ncbi:MAG: hypothetical protein WBA97_34340 [Actinophytocola sp.]
MAAFYGATAGVLSWLAFRAAAWSVERGVDVWGRVKDKRAEEKA